MNFGFSILDFGLGKRAVRKILRIESLSVNNPKSKIQNLKSSKPWPNPLVQLIIAALSQQLKIAALDHQLLQRGLAAGQGVAFQRAGLRVHQHVLDLSERRRIGRGREVINITPGQQMGCEEAAGGHVVGCGALHVIWEDLAEVRTVAVDPSCRGHKIGHRIVSELLAVARDLGVARVFVLTFQTSFFACSEGAAPCIKSLLF